MDWITNRLPTAADADADEEVAIQQRPNDVRHTYLHWSFVRPGMAWKRTPYWEGFELNEEPASISESIAPITGQLRRIVSLVEAESTVMAVADDGTAWYLSADWSKWTQLRALPDRG